MGVDEFLWIFPAALPSFEEFFQKFLATGIGSEKAESFLPEGASALVTSGDGRIKFYTTQERWFGMTYQEDRDIVKKEIAKKITGHYYPDRLWN